MTAETLELLEGIRRELQKLNSPWLTRNGAADYAECSPRWIDDLRAAGHLKTYWLVSQPRFKKTDIDALIEGGKIPANSSGMHKQHAAIASMLGQQVRTA